MQQGIKSRKRRQRKEESSDWQVKRSIVSIKVIEVNPKRIQSGTKVEQVKWKMKSKASL